VGLQKKGGAKRGKGEGQRRMEETSSKRSGEGKKERARISDQDLRRFMKGTRGWLRRQRGKCQGGG